MRLNNLLSRNLMVDLWTQALKVRQVTYMMNWTLMLVYGQNTPYDNEKL